MSAEEFQSAYLREIGVQTPISSFAAAQSEPDAVPQEADRQEAYPKPDIKPNMEAAEPEQAVEKPAVASVSVAADDDWQALKAKVEACKACVLAESRVHAVFGEGNVQADVVFIADAPGRDEDMAGQAFVGSSGALFTRMLAAIGLRRDDVYMMHGVKCRPQHNRDPKPDEFAACEPFVAAQFERINPKVICMLGRVVAQAMLNTDASLTELRQGRFSYRGIPVLVIDHPSYLLRAQQNKQRAWQDLLRLQSFLNTLH